MGQRKKSHPDADRSESWEEGGSQWNDGSEVRTQEIRTRERIAQLDANTRKHTSDNQVKIAKLKQSPARGVAEINSDASKYRADRVFEGQVYQADRRFDGVIDTNRTRSAVQASRERMNTETNQTRFAIADITTGRRLDGVLDTNRSRERIADLTTGRRLQGEIIRGNFNNQRETIRGEFGNQRESIRQSGAANVARIKGEFGVQQESIKQSGQARIARINQSGQTDRAAIAASAQVKVAGIKKAQAWNEGLLKLSMQGF